MTTNPQQHPYPSYSLSRLLLPVLPLLALAVLLELTRLDLALADWIYHASGNTWALRDHWLVRGLLHEGGRTLVAVMLVLLLAAFAASCCHGRLRSWRRGLGYVLVSALLAGLAVNLLKRVTHMDCPWDLLRYGGEYPYTGLFEAHPGTFRHGACFPAGHASAGYSWLGLWLLARDKLPKWRWPVLGAVLLLGAVFGIAQQLRGAHFLSHDLWTLAICWTVAVLVYVAFGRRPGRPALQN